jgi:lysine 6-dehydrogenase
MSRILVLGAGGAMATVAVEDLLRRTSHELVLADLSVERLEPLRSRQPDRVHTRVVDVRDGRVLASAVADVDAVLNATYMRYAVSVARAAIDAGVHLVDLGSYDETTLELLALDEHARRAGCRVVPGSGASPGLIALLGRHGADQLTSVRSIELYSHLNDPIGMSPGIVLTRFESSVGDAPVLEDGVLRRRPCFADGRTVDFPAPIGPIRVHHLPHPEPITLPRYVDVQDVTYMLGYGDEEERLVRALRDLGFHSDEPVAVGDVSVSPAAFAAAVIGARGIEPARETVNAKHVVVTGARDGVDIELIYDLVVRCVGESASALLTGVCAAIGLDLVAQGGPVGVVPAEGAFDPPVFLRALAERGIAIRETRIARGLVR